MGNLEYKIFKDKNENWYVAAKKEKRKIKIIQEGNDLGDIYRSILIDMEIHIPIAERDMEISYEPTKEDFKHKY